MFVPQTRKHKIHVKNTNQQRVKTPRKHKCNPSNSEPDVGVLRCSKASQKGFLGRDLCASGESSQSLRCWSFGRERCLRCGKTGEESVRRRCWSGWARSRERTGAGGEAGVPLVGSAGGDSRAMSGASTNQSPRTGLSSAVHR